MSLMIALTSHTSHSSHEHQWHKKTFLVAVGHPLSSIHKLSLDWVENRDMLKAPEIGDSIVTCHCLSAEKEN